jgi:hypothetical protein
MRSGEKFCVELVHEKRIASGMPVLPFGIVVNAKSMKIKR